MKKKILIAFIGFFIGLNSLFSQETFKTMFYNLLNFPLQEPATERLQQLNTIISDYQPDLFMVCELNNETGADAILNLMQQSVDADYEMANFVTNTSDDDIGDQNDLQNLIYYNSSKFILESQTEVATIFRDFNHYKLKLNTTQQDTNPIILDVIVCHLKSSSGTDNQALRLQMVDDLVSYLSNTSLFDDESYVLLGGDLNVYTNSEPAFVELLDNTNNITFIDPANRIGSWHNNVNYIDVFTQSTRTQTGLGGATGGFDDRFDFILTSESMQTSNDLYFVNGSYKVYGNNSNPNCYNDEINSSNCGGSDYNFSIRDALYYFSDHLPVILEIETNQTLLNVNEEQFVSFGLNIVGTNVISSTIDIKINDLELLGEKLHIYNSIGQLIFITPISTNELTIDVSSLASGIYYIVTPTMNTEPLKFVKVN